MAEATAPHGCSFARQGFLAKRPQPMFVSQIVLLVIGLCYPLTSQGMAVPVKKVPPPPPPPMPVAFLLAQPEFHIFDDALNRVNAVHILESTTKRSGSITIFAPTDAAWNEPVPVYGNKTKPTHLVAMEDCVLGGPALPFLRTILNHHIVQGYYNSSDFYNNEEIPALSGESVTMNVNLSQPARVIQVDNVTIERKDMFQAHYGVVHRIGQVLIPPSIQHQVSTLCYAKNFTILKTPLVGGPAAGPSADIFAPAPSMNSADVPHAVTLEQWVTMVLLLGIHLAIGAIAI